MLLGFKNLGFMMSLVWEFGYKVWILLKIFVVFCLVLIIVIWYDVLGFVRRWGMVCVYWDEWMIWVCVVGSDGGSEGWLFVVIRILWLWYDFNLLVFLLWVLIVKVLVVFCLVVLGVIEMIWWLYWMRWEKVDVV